MRAISLAGAVLAALVFAAPAGAGLSVSGSNGVISVNETSPGKDKLLVEVTLALGGAVFTNSAGFDSVDFPCDRLADNRAGCPVGGTGAFLFNLGEKNDRVTEILEPGDPTLANIDWVYRLGAGNDKFFGDYVREDVRSGIGEDRLNGFGGDDFLSAGKDNDKLDGGDGNDTCKGGPGRDQATACELVNSVP
jgi:Ca2+-binding RTX toxin-like protein